MTITPETKGICSMKGNSKKQFEYVCESCGILCHNYGLRIAKHEHLLCGKCQKKETYLKHYGVDNPAKSQDIQQRIKSNCDEKYGGRGVAAKSIRDKVEQTTLKRFGTTYALSTPDGGKEHWNANNDEVEKSCDEWIDICLSTYKCKRYLFVVDKTEKYTDKIVETLTAKSHFGKHTEYVICL